MTQVGVIPGTVGVASVAVVPLLGCRSSELPRRFGLVSSGAPRPTCESPHIGACPGALQGRCLNLKAFRKTVAALWNLLHVVGPLISCFCADGKGTPRHDVTCSVVCSCPKRSLRSSVIHRSSARLGCVTAKFSSELDQAALYLSSSALTLMCRASVCLDPSTASFGPCLERWCLCNRLCSSIRPVRIFMMKLVFFGKIASDTTGLAVS